MDQQSQQLIEKDKEINNLQNENNELINQNMKLQCQNIKLQQKIQILQQRPTRQDIKDLSRSNLLLQSQHFSQIQSTTNNKSQEIQELQEIADHQTIIIQRLQDQLTITNQLYDDNINIPDLNELEYENENLRNSLEQEIKNRLVLEGKVRKLTYQFLNQTEQPHSVNMKVQTEDEIEKKAEIEKQCQLNRLISQIKQLKQTVQNLTNERIRSQIESVEMYYKSQIE